MPGKHPRWTIGRGDGGGPAARGSRKPAGAAEVLLAYAARLGSESNEDDVRNALAAVAVRDGKTEPLLLAALDDKSPSRRAGAAVALTRAGARDALPAIRKRLHDSDLTVRLDTVLALVSLKEKDAIPTLIDLLADLPRGRHGPIETILDRLAEAQVPLGLTSDEAAERKKYRDAWADWWKKNGDKIDLASLQKLRKFLGYTMLVLLDGGRILERDAAGKTRWQVDDLNFPLDAERLPGDRVLVAEHHAGRVTERDRKGHILWERRIDEPLMAQRLPNGHTFIAAHKRVIEVDRSGNEVFAHEPGTNQTVLRGRKLDNGDIALVISTISNVYLIEFVRLDATGKQLARFPVEVQTSGGRIEVLPNGRVLAPLQAHNKVVEYDATGKIVWDVDVAQPIAAVRLANGHTMVTSYQDQRALELDESGKVVEEFKAGERVMRGWRRRCLMTACYVQRPSPREPADELCRSATGADSHEGQFPNCRSLRRVHACASSSAQPVVQQPAQDAQADHLKKIARTIAKEPVYKKAPLYCLLVLGTAPKMRVWVVIDGDVLYVDLNGNGDLTDKGKAFRLSEREGYRFSPQCKVGDLVDSHTQTKHTDFFVGLFDGDTYRLGMEVSFENAKLPRLYGFANVTFARKPADAPIVHFGGPLTMGLSLATIEDRPAFVCAEIGTPGIGKGSFVYYTPSVFHAIDPKLKPELELEYADKKTGVVREKATFHRDSIEGVYLYPVQPGEKGDKREVKITLSFPGWKDGKVVPRSFSRPWVTLEK